MGRIVTTHHSCRQRYLVVLGICGLIGPAVAEPASSAENAFDGAYTGSRVLTKGSSQLCVRSEGVSVTIRGGALTFSDSVMRDFSIGFDPRRDGSFGLISTAIGGASVFIEGRLVGGVLEADVTDGPCEHHWHLTKNPP